jgi:hypothetical protein
MSIASLAEDSALRLQPTASTGAVLDTAARAAAKAAKDNPALTEDDAMTAGVAAGQAAAGEGVTSSVISQLVKYVPTETIALYLAVETALGDITAPPGKSTCQADFTSRWVWLIVMTVATAMLTLGLSYRPDESRSGGSGHEMAHNGARGGDGRICGLGPVTDGYAAAGLLWVPRGGLESGPAPGGNHGDRHRCVCLWSDGFLDQSHDNVRARR